MRNQNVSPGVVSTDEVDPALRRAITELAAALGLVRVLTLLPVYAGTLDEVEVHLAAGWEAVNEVRRVVADAQTSGSSA
jgi:hypothetical protein